MNKLCINCSTATLLVSVCVIDWSLSVLNVCISCVRCQFNLILLYWLKDVISRLCISSVTVLMSSAMTTQLHWMRRVLYTTSYDWVLYLTLPYHTGKACYRLALRPPVGPMHVPGLTLRLLKPLANFKSELQCSCLSSLDWVITCVLQRSFSSDVSPAMQTMICNMAVQQLRLIVPLIRLTDADILRYVVTGSATATATADSVSSDNSFESACDAVTEDATEHDEVLHSTPLYTNANTHSAQYSVICVCESKSWQNGMTWAHYRVICVCKHKAWQNSMKWVQYSVICVCERKAWQNSMKWAQYSVICVCVNVSLVKTVRNECSTVWSVCVNIRLDKTV